MGRLGGVGVELVDEFAVVLLDDAALQFQGEGQAAVVEGEIFWQESEALDGFPLRHVSGEALYFRFDQGAHGGIGGHFLIGGKLGLGRNSRRIRDDEGDHESTLIADYHCVGYVGAGFEGVLDGLWRDEFASRGLDEIFLAVGDEEIVVGV